MKKCRISARLIILSLSMLTVLLAIGCSKPVDRLESSWSSPVAVSSSIAILDGTVHLHKYQDTLLGLQLQAGGSGKLLLLNRARNSWSVSDIPDAPKGYIWRAAAVDAEGRQLLVPNGYAENEQLMMKALIGTITENGNVRDIAEREWITDKKAVLGETGPNVKLNFLEKGGRQDVGLGLAILNGSEAYVPYCMEAAEVTRQGKSLVIDRAHGPFSSGVFHSTDSGRNWQLEKISDRYAVAPAICRTREQLYYFAGINPLWFSRKPIRGDKWDAPNPLTKSFASVYGQFDVAGEGDTAHICWMDRRHNKYRFNIDAPPVENNEIFYRHRKDSDKSWSKEVCLSKGLLYAYAPSISAEGDKVVVVWSGIRTADKQHTYLGPNDIYYVTSKDGGKTWSPPLKVTDGAKDGITSGKPQVILLNGVIHLLYTQGKRESQQLSAGLTRFDRSSWPIYHQQRPFPN